jgi:hypothetical protein
MLPLQLTGLLLATSILFRTKVFVVHAGHSLQQQPLNHHMLLQMESLPFTSFQSSNSLLAQALMETLDAMVVGTTMLGTT